MNDHQLTKYIYVKVMDIFPLQALHVVGEIKDFGQVRQMTHFLIFVNQGLDSHARVWSGCQLKRVH